MNRYTLTDFPYTPDRNALLETLRIRPGSSRAEEFEHFLVQAQDIARPKVIYQIGFIDEKGTDYVVIEGVRFNSRILRVNLDEVHRVFPYIVTCGRELEDWQESIEDLLHRFWVDAIKEQALFAAYNYFDQHLNDTFQPGPTSAMNPGSLADWPLTEQRPLFKLLGDVEASVGVRLTESCLMLPNKTVSGILFPTEASFASCQLCPREICPNRRAPYDAELYAKRYQSV